MAHTTPLLSTCKAFSNIGQRDENQDRYAIFEDTASGDFLAVVADGMGGHRGGSLAAEAIVAVAKKCWQERGQSEKPDQFLTTLVSKCQVEVNRVGEEKKIAPRSTLVALYKSNNTLTSVHVGDSRVMQFCGGKLVKKTIDHSLAQLHALQGKITEAEMASHPDQNKLTTSIGGEDEPEHEIETWDNDAGSDFILCSDGLWEVFNAEELGEVFDHLNPTALLEKLFLEKLAALDKQDNTTAIIIQGADAIAPTKKPSRGALWGTVAIFVTLAVTISIYLLLEQPKDIASSPQTIAPAMPPTSQDEANPQEPPILDITLADEVMANQNQTSERSEQEELENISQPDEEQPENAPNNDATKNIANIEASDTSKTMSGPSFAAKAQESDSRTENSKASEDTGATTGGEPEPLSPLNLQTDLPATTDDEARDVVTEKLNERLGPEGSLELDPATPPIGNTRYLRLQQKFKGIPIFGATVVVSQRDGKVALIGGVFADHLDPNLSIEPTLTYDDAVDVAAETLEAEIETVNEGKLVILKQDSNYSLAWYSNIEVATIPEGLILDAHTGKILVRLPRQASPEVW